MTTPIETEAATPRRIAQRLADWAHDDTTSDECARLLRASGAATEAAYHVEQACLTMVERRTT